MLHVPVASVLMFAIYAPPSMDTSFLAVWFFGVVLVGNWCAEQHTVANQAGGAECYPYKEERAQLEACNVLMAIVGVCFGVALMSRGLSPWNDGSGTRTALGLVGAALAWSSFPSIWALKDARQPAKAEEVPGLLHSAREAWAMDAFRVLCLANVFDGLASTTLTSFFLYYFIYVAELNPTEAANAMVAVPVTVSPSRSSLDRWL